MTPKQEHAPGCNLDHEDEQPCTFDCELHAAHCEGHDPRPLQLSTAGDTVEVETSGTDDGFDRVAGVPFERDEDRTRCRSYGFPGLRCTLDAGHTQQHANLSDRWS